MPLSETFRKMTTIRFFISALLLIISFFGATTAMAQMSNEPENDMVDSLIVVYNKTSDKHEKLMLLNEISFHHNNVDSTIVYAQKLIDLAHQLKQSYYEARGLYFLAWALYSNSEYLQASEMSRKAILLADSIGDKKLLADNYYQLGNEYTMLNDVSLAIEYYHKALDIQEELQDTIRICDILKNISQTDAENMLYDDAFECIARSKKLDEEYHTQYYLSENYYYLAYIYYRQYTDKQYSAPNASLLHEAKSNILTSMQLAEKYGYEYGLMRTYTVASDILIELVDIEQDATRRAQLLDSCYTYINNGYQICRRFGQASEQLDVNGVYLRWLILSGRDKEAYAFLDSISECYNMQPDELAQDISVTNHNYALYYEMQRDYQKALKYERLSHEQKLLTQKNDYAAKASRYMAQGDFNVQLRERELRYENETRIRTIIIVGGSVLLIICILFSITIAKSYSRTRAANRLLDVKNNELEQQKEEILAQNDYLAQQKEQIEMQRVNLQEQNKIISQVNKQLTDSINYASLIQRAALPSEGQMNSLFGTHMVIYNPLNIVSGDFYWASQAGNLKMLVVADCTGHGVPGAFLSMLGVSILNDIAARYATTEVNAATVLDQMRRIFMNVLHQEGKETDNHDGIDLALIIINPEKKMLSYAGAYRPIIIVRNHEATKYSPDRMPIGSHYNQAEHFTNHDVELQQGDTIYLFTDGMTDQFGYDSQNRLHKYTSKRLRTLLADIHNQPFSVQKTKIELSFESWRLETQSLTDNGMPYEQTDDALLIGIRI